jgi:pilus assembly protein Flp/PilA
MPAQKRRTTMLIPFLRAKLREFVRNESGATAIEYGMIAGLIAVLLALVVPTVGTELFDTFNEVIEALGGTAVAAPE